MILKIFSVYDSKVESYLQPIFLHTKGEAIRCMQDCLENPEHQFTKHAEDFTLFYIGNYDNQTGICEPCKVMESLGNLNELKAVKVNNK